MNPYDLEEESGHCEDAETLHTAYAQIKRIKFHILQRFEASECAARTVRM